MRRWSAWSEWPDFFEEDPPSSHDRIRVAAEATARAKARGKPFEPVVGTGRKLARSVWGQAWCRHIESFHDFQNRLPRGRTYLRSGSVADLRIEPGRISARVAGRRLYEARIDVAACPTTTWNAVVESCRGGVSSLVALLEGRLPDAMLRQMGEVEDGLFPDLRQVKLSCSCPDWARLCKHLAAVLYGVGVRLDERPDLLFVLRRVDPQDLVDTRALPSTPSAEDTLTEDLSGLFGVEIDLSSSPSPSPSPSAREPQYVRRSELLDFGVDAGTIQRWLTRGVLRRTDERGWYEHTDASLAEFERRFGGA